MKVHLSSFVSLLVLVLLCSCARHPKSTAEIPHVLSHSYIVGVAPFTQPTTTSDLIVGRLPEPQGVAGADVLEQLDDDFRSLLANKHRAFRFLKKPSEQASTHLHTRAQPDALPRWLAFGKTNGVDILLVPQVLDWHEREGSKAGVTRSAQVRIEFFLLKISEGRIMSRSVFEEKQLPLAENFLQIGTFIKRKGVWISAREMALEAMNTAKKEFGL